jgi:hypothetical protein
VPATGGYLQFKSATPQYCGQPNRLRTLKSCGSSKFDFRILLPVPLLSSPFSSAQDGIKNQLKIFLELSVSLETKNLP